MHKFIDLHTHSTCSDGTLTPTQVIKAAKDVGLSAIALTDHDTVDGLKEAVEAGKKYGIEVITGIEFSVQSDTEMHLLGLGFEIDCPAITSILDEMIYQRELRNQKVVRLLSDIGINITVDDILAEATSKVTGRSQIAKAMLRKGYVSSINEAFEKYLKHGKPAFVERTTLSPEKAIEIIKKSGGVSSLAHLNQTGKSDDKLYKILTDMKSAGLDAIEGYYTEYSDEMSEKYRQMASKTGLKLTGGSDFHGENKDGYNIGTGKGNLQIPYSLLKNLFEQ